jgi:hypothetical protein
MNVKILKSIGSKYRKTNHGRKFLVERGDIVAVRIRIKFLSTVHNLRITGDDRSVFYLDETCMGQPKSFKKVHLAGLIKKGRLESSSRKREQAYCVPRRISKNGLYS